METMENVAHQNKVVLPDGRRGDIVQCFGMPYGIDGGLHIVLEFVAFCDDAMSV